MDNLYLLVMVNGHDHDEMDRYPAGIYADRTAAAAEGRRLFGYICDNALGRSGGEWWFEIMRIVFDTPARLGHSFSATFPEAT